MSVGYILRMRQTVLTTGDQLVNALHGLGVNFIMGGRDGGISPFSRPGHLIAALARSEEARLRLSLIPLFLEHPEFARSVRTAAKKLDPSARLVLQCYYSAAVWLAVKYRVRAALPDLFSRDLNLTLVDDPEENLRALAKRQKELSGLRVNWLATYQHAGQVWRKGLETRRG
jgi:hypothetical protein